MSGETPAHFAAGQPDRPDVLQLILDAAIERVVQNSESAVTARGVLSLIGHSPIAVAITAGHNALVGMILDACTKAGVLEAGLGALSLGGSGGVQQALPAGQASGSLGGVTPRQASDEQQEVCGYGACLLLCVGERVGIASGGGGGAGRQASDEQQEVLCFV